MEPQIREYGDALFERALSEARDAREKEIVELKKQMAQRGMSQGFSGIEYGGMIQIHAAFIGRQMMARLASFRDAFEHASTTPSKEDIQQIWQAVREVYETGLQSVANHLRNLSKRRGGSPDATGSLEAAVAHPHDKVLNEWKVWCARISLGEPPQESFAINKVPTVKELPQKDDLLVDLDRLLQTCAQIGVLFIDLDNFKAVNDTMGHDEGDKCLEQVAQIIGSAVLHKGRVYRYANGDEFIVLLPNLDEAEATATAERIRRAIDLWLPGGSVKVTASIGVIIAVKPVYKSAEEAMKAADRAMYEAKVEKNAVRIVK